MSEYGINTTVWNRAGYRCYLNFPAATPAEAMALLDQVQQAGFLPREPGIEPGEEKQKIGAVTCRVYQGTDGEEKTVLDFWPEWRGDFGKFSYFNKYINNQQDIDEFEKGSGLVFKNIPVSNSQMAGQRTQGQPSRFEVPANFSIVIAPKRTENGEIILGKPDKNGKQHPKYDLIRYIPGSGSPAPSQPGSGPSQAPAPAAPRPADPNVELFRLAEEATGLKRDDIRFPDALDRLLSHMSDGGLTIDHFKADKGVDFRAEVLKTLKYRIDSAGGARKLMEEADAKYSSLPF